MVTLLFLGTPDDEQLGDIYNSKGIQKKGRSKKENKGYKSANLVYQMTS